jgi:4-aminobutyrate aminotransferase-like enzyme
MVGTELTVFQYLESNVRSYCRSWPTLFDTAHGAWLRDSSGRECLDFSAGAGALNYGHNNPMLKRAQSLGWPSAAWTLGAHCLPARTKVVHRCR